MKNNDILPLLPIALLLLGGFLIGFNLLPNEEINHPPPEAQTCEQQAWYEIHHCIDETPWPKAKSPCLESGSQLLRACAYLEKVKKNE